MQSSRTHVEIEDLQTVEIPASLSPMASYASLGANAQGKKPYSQVCQIYITYSDGTSKFVSGFFVGPYTIATSARNLRPSNNVEYKTLKVYYSFTIPNTQTVRFGSVGIAHAIVPVSYTHLLE